MKAKKYLLLIIPVLFATGYTNINRTNSLEQNSVLQLFRVIPNVR